MSALHVDLFDDAPWNGGPAEDGDLEARGHAVAWLSITLSIVGIAVLAGVVFATIYLTWSVNDLLRQL